jgi:alpha-L-arabinofuranosidase
VNVVLKVQGGFAVGDAGMKVVAADSLDARNTLDKPDAIQPTAGNVETDGQSLRFSLPAYSAAVVTMKK